MPDQTTQGLVQSLEVIRLSRIDSPTSYPTGSLERLYETVQRIERAVEWLLEDAVERRK